MEPVKQGMIFGRYQPPDGRVKVLGVQQGLGFYLILGRHRGGGTGAVALRAIEKMTPTPVADAEKNRG